MDFRGSNQSSIDSSRGKSSLLLRSAAGATFLVALQISSRVLTFIVNQLLLRYSSPELLGLSTQLEVYSISALFFARESLRTAIQRQTDSDGNEFQQKRFRVGAGRDKENRLARKTQEIINLAYISICLGILFSVLLAWGYWRSAKSVRDTPYFKLALQLYGLATLLELLAEPCFVVVQQKSEYKVRATAEGVGTASRCVVICASSVAAAHQGIDIGALPFALGQCMYAASLLFVYYQKVSPLAIAEGFSLAARPILSNDSDYVFSYFSPYLLSLGTSLFAQGIVKHLLTQGDIILISYLASLKAQGIYALVSNYGGLIARMLFQPLEESSRSYFGKLLSSVDSKPSKDLVKAASRDLQSLLRFYALLSVSAISIGPTIAPILLNLVAGSRWTSIGAGDVLAKYCYYIPLLAMNGVAEAFISSVATKSELNRQSAWMLVFSVGFAAAGYVFLRVFKMGAEGLVWANSINMALRILWSYSFIDSYLKRNESNLSIREIMPQSSTFAVGVCVAAIMAHIKANFTGAAADIIKSGLTTVLFVVLLAFSERQYFRQFYDYFRKRVE